MYSEYDRFLFYNIAQIDEQGFIEGLKKVAKTFEFADDDSMVRDILVVGVKDKATQERLFRELSLDLRKAVKQWSLARYRHKS